MNRKIIKYKNGYSVVQPLDDIRRESVGFVMVVNPNGEILKFFESDVMNRKAQEYLDYVSLSKWDKLKYWWNYKRG